LISTLSTMMSDAHLMFAWDASGNCTQVSVQNASFYAPKQL
jgi:hypothetical protein